MTTRHTTVLIRHFVHAQTRASSLLPWGEELQFLNWTNNFIPAEIFHTLLQAKYLFQFVCGDKYLFHFLRKKYSTK